MNQDVIEINYQEPKAAPLEISFEGLKLDKHISIENWVAKFPEIKFHGTGAVIKEPCKVKMFLKIMSLS